MNPASHSHDSLAQAKLLEALLAGHVSRNAHFSMFTSKVQRAVHRRAKLLRALLHEATNHLCFHQAYSVLYPHNGMMMLELHNPQLRLSRKTPLATWEADWLLRRPQMASLLKRKPNTFTFALFQAQPGA